MKTHIKPAALVFFIFLAGSCSKPQPAEEKSSKNTLSPAEENKAEKLHEMNIQIRGSDSEVNVVQAMAEAYMNENEGSRIAVTGGGSGAGIAALLNKTVDIANASRKIKPTELAKAKADGIEPKRFVFAMDAIALIVHPENETRSMTVAQAASIFKGEVSNWNQVGGPDLAITCYGRQSNSGTFEFFKKHVLKSDFSDQVRQMNGNAQIVESVKQDKGGIGYVAAGYVLPGGKPLAGVIILPVAEEEGREPVSINSETVASGSYPIVRPFNQYINGKPDRAVADFLRFELSEQGQKIVVEQGFFPVKPELRALSEALIAGN